jgi:hypothetical protein
LYSGSNGNGLIDSHRGQWPSREGSDIRIPIAGRFLQLSQRFQSTIESAIETYLVAISSAIGTYNTVKQFLRVLRAFMVGFEWLGAVIEV